MINKKQLDILKSDKSIKLYGGSRGLNPLMTVEELEVLKQNFTPDKFKALYLDEFKAFLKEKGID